VRHVSRSPVATERLALTPSGQVRYQLKTPVPRRHQAPCDRAAGLHGEAGGAGAAAADAPDEVSRGVRAAQQAARGSDAGAPGHRRPAAKWHGHRFSQAADTPAPGDELGAAAEARVLCRDPGLCPLRRVAQGHRQYRRVGGDREDPRASGEHGS
jgi:hypothetical protein